MRQIPLVVGIDADEFVDGLIENLAFKDVKALILKIDAAMMDYEFTSELIEALQKSLDNETGK